MTRLLAKEQTQRPSLDEFRVLLSEVYRNSLTDGDWSTSAIAVLLGNAAVIRARTASQSSSHPSPPGAGDAASPSEPAFRDVVRLEGVGFTYPGASRPALDALTVARLEIALHVHRSGFNAPVTAEQFMFLTEGNAIKLPVFLLPDVPLTQLRDTAIEMQRGGVFDRPVVVRVELRALGDLEREVTARITEGACN